MLDSGLFAQALAGCESMFFCIPQADDAANVIEHYETFAQIAVNAAKQSGTQRIVYLSGAGKDSPLAQQAGSATALYHAEDILAKSGLALRALRCPVFYESTLWQIGAISHAGMMFGVMPGSYPHGQVSVRDIARTAARLLIDSTWEGVESLGVFGPSEVSMDEVAQWISKAINAPVRYQQISLEQYVGNLRKLGVGAPLAEAVGEMFDAIGKGLDDAEPRSVDSATALSMPQWIDEVFVPAFNNPPSY